MHYAFRGSVKAFERKRDRDLYVEETGAEAIDSVTARVEMYEFLVSERGYDGVSIDRMGARSLVELYASNLHDVVLMD